VNRILRRRHRLIIVLLGILLPVLLVAAILTREEMPRHELMPPERQANQGAPVFNGQLTEGDLLCHAHIFHSETGDLLELQPLQPLPAPDILVYWVAEGSTREEGRLLGTLGSGPALFDLPATARSGGRLELYSLGWQRSAGSLKLPVTGEGNP